MTEEKETPEAEETETPGETAEAEAPQETAEAEAPPEVAETEEAEADEKPQKAEKTEPDRYSRAQLQRLTTTKLREIALELGDVVGVHGMKKDELVDAIFELRGIEEADATQEVSVDKSSIKSEIKELKVRRDSALESGDAFELKRVRKRIKRLKRALRKVS